MDDIEKQLREYAGAVCGSEVNDIGTMLFKAADTIARLERERETVQQAFEEERAKVAELIDRKAHDPWVWIGDESEDDVETLACPVLMSADQVRAAREQHRLTLAARDIARENDERHIKQRDEALRELAEAREQKDGAYGERDRLVAALSKVFPAWLGRHPEDDASWDDDWRWIVFVQLPTGQASWHIHDSEREWFSHLVVEEDRPAWDGHTTDEKYERLAEMLNGCAVPESEWEEQAELTRRQAMRAEKAEAERDGVRGERNRTAAYVLGGQVEGAPTTEYNWIQRARELVRIEAEAREHCKARERRNVEASKENRDLRARAEKAEAERDEAIAAANKREADWIERIVRAIRGKSDPWDRSTKLEDVRKEAERMAAELARLRDVVRELTDRGRVRPGSDWHEDMGDVLWTDVPIEEPPYCGTPLDQDFPWQSTPVAKLFFVQLPPVFTGEFKSAEAALGEEGT